MSNSKLGQTKRFIEFLLTPMELRIWNYAVSVSHRSGRFIRDARKMANNFGVTKDTVYSHTKSLVAKGFLIETKPSTYSRGRGSRTPSEYRALTLAEWRKENPEWYAKVLEDLFVYEEKCKLIAQAERDANRERYQLLKQENQNNSPSKNSPGIVEKLAVYSLKISRVLSKNLDIQVLKPYSKITVSKVTDSNKTLTKSKRQTSSKKLRIFENQVKSLKLERSPCQQKVSIQKTVPAGGGAAVPLPNNYCTACGEDKYRDTSLGGLCFSHYQGYKNNYREFAAHKEPPQPNFRNGRSDENSLGRFLYAWFRRRQDVTIPTNWEKKWDSSLKSLLREYWPGTCAQLIEISQFPENQDKFPDIFSIVKEHEYLFSQLDDAMANNRVILYPETEVVAGMNV
jgi:hypothetical protein